MKIINYTTIEKNIQSILKSNEICLVLKNDAYGFKMEEIVKIAHRNSIHKFAVNTLEEAIHLRSLTPFKIILFSNYHLPMEDLKTYHILPTAGSLEEMEQFSRYQIPFALEIDSGMNRFGIKTLDEEWLKNPYLDTLYIHFYKKQEKNKEVMQYFAQLCKSYQKDFHFGGSLVYQDTTECIRIGKLIYQNSVQLMGHIQNIKEIYEGESVGYEGEYVAREPERIAIIDIGYYNGLKISFSGFVFCRGKRYPVIGRVCMNHCFILADEFLHIGDIVEFYGENISLEEFLKENKMSEYESFLFIR